MITENLHIILGTIIPAIGGYLWGQYKNYREEKELEKQEYALIKKGLQSLLRDRRLQVYYVHLEKGYANTDDKACFDAMHTAYAGLGKNGVMDTVYKQYMTLPEK